LFNYLLRRLLYALVALLVVVTVTFLFMHIIPGGPFQREKALPEAVKKNIEARYKLDQPLHIQYIDYLSHLVRGDLGPSYKYRGMTVNDIIRERFPVSVQLGSVSILIALLLGIPAGIMAALNQNKPPDYVVMFFSTIGIAMPSFVIGTMLMYFLSYKWGLLPSATWGSPQHVIMPAIALAGMPTAYIARLTRSSMLEVLGQDYMKTAVAKGLSRIRILWVHGIKNAIIPVVTYLGPLVAGILTGSFVVENIFAVPGLGKHYVTSIYNRDYTVILGVTVFYCILLIFMNLLVDLLYPLLDPRIKLGARKEQV
jgi:oligopeptide transport system permease protein